MRLLIALLLGGLALLFVQGGLASLLPRGACPDLALLYVLALGLHAPTAMLAFVVSVFLGYATDLLSGSLLGQHALLRLLAVSAALIACRQLNLRGATPWLAFAFAAVMAYGLGLRMVTDLSLPATASEGVRTVSWFFGLTLHAGWTALFAPSVALLVERVSAWGGDDETARRSLVLGHGRTP